MGDFLVGETTDRSNMCFGFDMPDLSRVCMGWRSVTCWLEELGVSRGVCGVVAGRWK